MLTGKNILLGISGSIAAYKTPLIVRKLVDLGANVRIILTKSAEKFVTTHTLSTVSNHAVLKDFFKNDHTGEWENHVALAKWCDLLLIAPATANTIAKMNLGICDNLLLATFLSCKSTVAIAPAMDLDMFKHPSFRANLNGLKKKKITIIPAENGFLASGLSGEGRMAEVDNIIRFVKKKLDSSSPLFKNKSILITAGGTIEKIDPVRYISNFSTGKMGCSLALEASKKGANVNLVINRYASGLNLIPENQTKINVIKIDSAKDMLNACKKWHNLSDILIMSAAVADYKPKHYHKEKIKKNNSSTTPILELEKNKDILTELSKKKSKHQIHIGFALESEDNIKLAIKKLKAKHLDAIIYNSLSDPGAGFAYDTNTITIIDKNEQVFPFPNKSKKEVSEDIINYIETLIIKQND